MTPSSEINLLDLPNEIMIKILDDINPLDLSIKGVCKKTHSLFQDPLITLKLFSSLYPERVYSATYTPYKPNKKHLSLLAQKAYKQELNYLKKVSDQKKRKITEQMRLRLATLIDFKFENYMPQWCWVHNKFVEEFHSLQEVPEENETHLSIQTLKMCFQAQKEDLEEYWDEYLNIKKFELLSLHEFLQREKLIIQRSLIAFSEGCLTDVRARFPHDASLSFKATWWKMRLCKNASILNNQIQCRIADPRIKVLPREIWHLKNVEQIGFYKPFSYIPNYINMMKKLKSIAILSVSRKNLPLAPLALLPNFTGEINTVRNKFSGIGVIDASIRCNRGMFLLTKRPYDILSPEEQKEREDCFDRHCRCVPQCDIIYS